MKPIALALCIVAAVAAGCGSSPSHTQEIADARSAIRGAEELGATDKPDAALYLQLAEEQLAAAQEDIEEGEHARAQRRLARAKLDAELAIELSHAAELQDKAKRVLDDVEEINRNETL